MRPRRSDAVTPAPVLRGRTVLLRPIVTTDFRAWRRVRTRNRRWLEPWEPKTLPGQPDVATDRDAFVARCRARDRERQLGTGYGFGIFHDDLLAGEINVNSIQRGPFQSCYVGYWIDRDLAGQGLVPEAVVMVLRFAFEDLGLHRVQIAIIPRNERSRRVVEKLDLRDEGLAERYLEIAGVWEDHIRYAITAEEWTARREELLGTWVD